MIGRHEGRLGIPRTFRLLSKQAAYEIGSVRGSFIRCFFLFCGEVLRSDGVFAIIKLYKEFGTERRNTEVPVCRTPAPPFSIREAAHGKVKNGQLARLTNQKTLIGRILDGFSGDVWFFAIYFALCCRMMPQFMPATNMKWGIAIWAFAFVAGIMCHSPQASLSDYYRQIHLLFLKGKSGSELDTSKQQKNNYLKASQEKNAVMRWMSKAFFYNYANYCRSQEKRTPAFQKLKKELTDRYGDLDNIPDDLRKEFLNASRPLMKYTNILTFNVRAICIYATCLLNIPWVYFLIEIIPLTCLYVYMHRRHEHICISLYNKISNFS